MIVHQCVDNLVVLNFGMDYDHFYFMRQALNQARLALKSGEVPVGAIIVWENRIIARAHNIVERLTDPTAHAEMQAITSATNYLNSKYLNHCVAYITLEPCSMCAGAFYWSRLGHLVFAASDPQRGFHSQGVSLHPKCQVTQGILQMEAQELLNRFFQKKRNKISSS